MDFLVADFNDDSLLNVAVLDLLVQNIAIGPGDSSIFDLTGNGLVGFEDRDAWLVLADAVNLASGNPYLLGDANLDGVVDGQDFIVWNSNRFTAGDFNADGVVDGLDFIVWNASKFQSANTLVFDLSPQTSERTDGVRRRSVVDLREGLALPSIRSLPITYAAIRRVDAVFAGTYHHEQSQSLNEEIPVDYLDDVFEDALIWVV